MSHAHRDDLDSSVVVRPWARWVLYVVLGLILAATVIGVVVLWPDHDPRPDDDSAAFLAPGVTLPRAVVTRVEKVCPRTQQLPSGQPEVPSQEQQQACGGLHVRVSDGKERGDTARVDVAPEVSRSDLARGDHVRLVRIPAQSGAPTSYAFFSVDRSRALLVMALLFVLVVVAVARLRGLLALLGLAYGAVVLLFFMLPALLTGESGLGVALAGSAAIMLVVLYLAHGVSLRTSAALVGTLVGIVITAFTGVLAVGAARLTGISDEGGQLLSSLVSDVRGSGIITAAVIVAGLGVLNDVTITQASAVWELRAAAPDMPRGSLFGSAMRIGRDHIASTIYTIVFAYTGSALAVLLLLFLYDQPFLQVLSTEDISEEVVRTLASGIGLVLAVPATTAIAVALAAPVRRPAR